MLRLIGLFCHTHRSLLTLYTYSYLRYACVSKETCYKAKETYDKAKETYYKAKETY